MNTGITARSFSGRFMMVVIALLSLVTHCYAERWPLWHSYAEAFIDEQGRVVDHQSGDRTTSEGQSYGLFFSLVANDPATFQKLLHWTQDNLAGGDLSARLPAWSWGRAGDGQWKVLDQNSASDSDLWIAYSLLEAGRLWQQPRYTVLGNALAARIAEKEVAELPGFGLMLLPGETGFQPAANTWVLNPSYLPLPLVVRMAKLFPGSRWGAVAANAPHFISASVSHGFAMDWVSYSHATGFRPVAAPGQLASDAPLGSYDASRIYLWAGMTDDATSVSREVLHALSGMSQYLAGHPLPPEKVSVDGSVLNANAPVGFSAAVVPYLEALGSHSAFENQEARLTAERGPSGLYGHPPAYYDQNLAMFGEGWAAKRFSFGPDGELKVKWKR